MQVSAQVRKMPLWKLQTVGRQKLDFLYNNIGTGYAITLKDGVCFCFRKHYPLVVDLIKGAWAHYVRRYNADRLGEKADLHEFLFGSERANLTVVRPILQHFQTGLCFYCRRPIREEAGHVDHFVPWARYPVDLGHNFVLAHGSCNERKSDRLPAARHLNAWVEHNQRVGQDKGREFERQGVIHDLSTSARIMDWAYRQTSAFEGLTWLRAKELEPLPTDWNEELLAGQWTTAGSLNTAREYHTSTLLPSGGVLLVGGADGVQNLSSAELYDSRPGPITLMHPGKPSAGVVQFAFTGAANGTNTVLATTNIASPLATWAEVGVVEQISPGLYLFTEPQAANNPQRFYCIRSP
jgi:5-methylcytosine-specific restriction endonuclease McrA